MVLNSTNATYKKGTSKEMSSLKQSLKLDLSRAKEPLPSPCLPSLDELIAESRALGWDDLAASMEKLRHLETPEGQRALERRERRLSRL